MKALFLLLLLSVAVPAAAQFAQFDPAGNLVLLSSGSSGRPTLHGPASRLARSGEAVSLSVAFTGANVTFRWYFNDQSIPGATNDTLLFGEVSASNVGGYFVIASNNFGSSTSQVARVEFDSDHDGLGDSWEMANFGSLTNQNAAMDKDNDGTPNQLEFQDGTSPTNRLLLFPRLAVRAFGGRVTVSPDATVYKANDLVTLTAIPDTGLSFIGWSGDLTGPTNPASLLLTGNHTVQATFGLPLAFALNTTNAVMTGGAGGWFGQTKVSQDAEAAAAVAPPLAGNTDPFLETSIVMNREGVASFWWKIDAENQSALVVSLEGEDVFFDTRRLIGSTDWQWKTLYLPVGTNHVRWTFFRYGGGWSETRDLQKPRDTAYLDRLVVTEYPNPQLDGDGNALPDLWEYRYFDKVGTDSTSDPDEDGIATGVELTDGTNPNATGSVKPRLAYLIEGQGSATSSPSQSFYSYGQLVTNLAVPANGWNFMGWVGPFENNYFFPVLNTNNPSTDHLYRAKTLRAVFGMPPGLAADSPGLTWTTSPQLPWYGQTLVSHDGLNASQSALTMEPFADTESWLETAVTGPGTLSFFWKASSAVGSDFGNDYLTLLVNSNEATDRLRGLTSWQPVILALPEGPQKLRWLFRRFYGYDTNALNTVWLDQVRFTPGVSLPEFIDLPASLQGYEGADLTFQVAARGTPPVTYQVLRNGTPLSQPSTNQLITVSQVTPALAGTWVVQAQNQAGAASSSPIPVNILAVPSHDAFENAIPLSRAASNLVSYSIGATAEAPEPAHDGYDPRASVWHRWTPSASGAVRFTAITTNPPSNLILAAYSGATVDDLTEIAAASEYAQTTNDISVARVDVSWNAIAGTPYSIVVDADEGGAFYQLSWASVPPPVNDAFAARLPLTGAFALVSGDNSSATAEPGEPPVFSIPPFFTIGASNTLWWSWTAPANGKLHIEPRPAETTALISVFTGSSLTSLNRLAAPSTAASAFDVVKGVAYAISADSDNDARGRFAFLLTMDAVTMRMVQAQGSNTGAFELLGPPQTRVIVQFSPNLKDWYSWSTNTIPGDGVLSISLDPPTYPDGGGPVSIPPAQKRFFRVLVP